MHYGSLWTVNRLRHPDIAADLNTFLATHRPLPYEELAMALGPDRTLVFSGSEIVRYAQYAVFAIAVLTAGLALVGLIAAVTKLQLSPALGAAGSDLLLSMRALMAPEGYLIDALARALGDNAPRSAVRSRTVAAYADWQRLSIGIASPMFSPLR